MIKIATVIKEIISESTELSFGFNQGLFNLSQLARFLKPLIATRAKKEISEKALIMSLSRLQREHNPSVLKNSEQFFIERISLNADLYIATYLKNSSNHAAVANLYRKVQRRGGYMTISEGMNEITVIVEHEVMQDVQQLFSEKPIIEKKGAISLGIRFHKKYLQIPGYLYKILQALTLQNINIWELSSTATEIAIYLDEKDRHLALETVLASFRQRK